jgi:hypothetical protein
MVPANVYPNVKEFVDNGKVLMKNAIAPIEHAVHNFAIEVLRGLHSTLVNNNDEEIVRIRNAVATAVRAIQSSGDAKAMDVLATQMKKLGSIENITTAMEGIVFIYKGNAYKFTGAFAPVNQILGLFRYGRGGAKVEEQKELRQALQQLLRSAPRSV